MKRFIQLLSLGALTLGATSCHVHEVPEGDLSQFTLHLNFETEFQRMDFSLDDTREDGRSRVYNNEIDHGVISYTVRAFPIIKGDIDKSIYREFNFMRNIADGYDCTFTLDLDAGNYRLMVFAQLAETEQGPFYYNDSNFWDIKLQGEYAGDTNYRDAFKGLMDVEIGSTFTANMTMTRPLGKYEFITTDLPEFIAQENKRMAAKNATRNPIEYYDVVFKYIGYMPSAYNLAEDRIVDSELGVEFHSTVTPMEGDEASLGFDYVFASTTQTYVTLQISLYDPETGERVSLSDTARIPVRRSYDTIVYGKFLYGTEQGGIGVDPGYNGDLNIFFDPTKK